MSPILADTLEADVVRAGLGSQDFAADPRNDSVWVLVNGELVTRSQARVSVFDSGFVLGDGVWEGIRLHRGRLVFLDAHLDRLFAGAAAIDLALGVTRAELRGSIDRVIRANAMEHGVHVRVMVTRGVKRSPNQDPRHVLGPPTIVIVAEHKLPNPALMTRGLALASVAIRCTPAEMFDMRLNSHSRLNLITALIQAIKAGADEALMLDPHGLVSSCNATNFFFVRGGAVHTSTGQYCFHGITRQQVIELCRANAIPIGIGDFTLGDARHADEAFVTGTFGGVTPVRSIDMRPMPAGTPGPITARLAALYDALKDEEAAR